MSAGESVIRFDFAYDGGGAGKGGTGTIAVNGKQVAQGRIDQTQGFSFRLMKVPMLVVTWVQQFLIYIKFHSNLLAK